VPGGQLSAKLDKSGLQISPSTAMLNRFVRMAGRRFCFVEHQRMSCKGPFRGARITLFCGLRVARVATIEREGGA